MPLIQSDRRIKIFRTNCYFYSNLQNTGMNNKKAFEKDKTLLRKIGLTDVPELVDYRLQYLEELQGKMDPAYKIQLRNDLTVYFKKAIIENRFVGFVAEINGKSVSFGGMVIREIPGDVNRSTYLEGDILNMYTVPEARRKGISSLILECLLDESKKMGMTKVALHTSKDGEKLYRKYHFSEPVYPYLERIID